jgi:NADPH:quinone reductase
MKAIQAADRGGYDALRLVDIPRPQPRAGQALVRVTSAGVTPLDRTVLAGLHPSARKLPLVPGNEGAGVVIEDPFGRFSVGERVLFFAGPGGVAEDGTFAEMTSVPSGNLAPLPGEIPDEIAGGLPVAYLSAFLALRQAGFREGQSVLAPGAGGSVGNATLRVPERSERHSWCQRPEARRRRPLPVPTADCARSASSTSSARASPTGLPGSLLAASTQARRKSTGGRD